MRRTIGLVFGIIGLAIALFYLYMSVIRIIEWDSERELRYLRFLLGDWVPEYAVYVALLSHILFMIGFLYLVYLIIRYIMGYFRG